MPPYLFVTHDRHHYHDPLCNVDFCNDWLELTSNGVLIVKGDNPCADGYAWGGCSPKWVFLDVVFGTPDGAPLGHGGRPKTYNASLIHDALCQFRLEHGLEQWRVDKIFRNVLVKDGFRLSALYYHCVVIYNLLTRRGRA